MIMNDKIRSREVRLIDENGENHGVVATLTALKMAQTADLDLVIISPNQDPPVAKILNYGKYKYELEKKAKETKKKQHTVEIKEIKIRYKIDTHDYQVRVKNIKKFIAQGNKVKIVVMLRGREMQHSNLAFDLVKRFLTDLEAESIIIEKRAQLEGRNVTLFLAPQPVQ
ncbi:MAG: translation initiation factor IF-3 [bacterium]